MTDRDRAIVVEYTALCARQQQLNGEPLWDVGRRLMLEAAMSEPGITQKKVAETLSTSQRIICYWLPRYGIASSRQRKRLNGGAGSEQKRDAAAGGAGGRTGDE